MRWCRANWTGQPSCWRSGWFGVLSGTAGGAWDVDIVPCWSATCIRAVFRHAVRLLAAGQLGQWNVAARKST